MKQYLPTLTGCLLLCAHAFAATAESSGDAKTAEGKPNIVVILADDLRADCIGAVNPRIHTPNIDRLAKQGVLFNNCYIMGSNMTAVCTPSRTMLMSGRSLFHLPTDIRVGGNMPTVPVMSTVFREAGYNSLYFGKEGNTYRPANRSFDQLIPLNHQGMKKKEAEEAYFATPLVSWLADPARKNKPFFAFYAPAVPHDALCPLPEDLAHYQGDKCPPLPPNAAAQHADVAGFNLKDTNVRTYDVPAIGKLLTPLKLEQWPEVIARYYAYTTLLDRQVGRILDELERSGAAKNTIVVFSSDNGHSLSEQGLIHKESVYEQDIRVPLIVSGPGITAGKRSNALVYLSDLFPTICQQIGVPIPSTVQTQSFLPSIQDPAKPHRTTLYHAYRDEMRAFRDDQYKIILFENQRIRMFDLKADPFEIKDLSVEAAHEKRVAAMTVQARAAGKALGDDPANSPFWRKFDGKHAPKRKTKE